MSSNRQQLGAVLQDPAAAFCTLRQLIDAEAAADQMATWRQEPAFMSQVHQNAQRAASGPYQWPRPPTPQTAGWSESKLLAAELLGIDEALGDAHPSFVNRRWHPASPARPIEQLRLRAQACGRFDERGPGALLPKHVAPGRAPEHQVADLDASFYNVLWVPPEAWAKADFGRIPADEDFPTLAGSEPVRVAVCPLVANPRDMRFHAPPEPAPPLLSCSIVPSPEIAARIRSAIAAADLADAHILMFPELVGGQWVADEARAALRESRQPSSLQWVIPGTGALRGLPANANAAAVLHGQFGGELWRQQKRDKFIIKANERTAYPFPVARKGRLEENLAPGRRLVIRESNIGRVAILICEDLASLTTLGATAHAFGVSLVLAPTMSRPLARRRWTEQRAQALADKVGTCTVAATSLVVPRLAKVDGAAAVALAVTPEGVEVGATADAAGVVVFELRRHSEPIRIPHQGA